MISSAEEKAGQNDRTAGAVKAIDQMGRNQAANFHVRACVRAACSYDENRAAIARAIKDQVVDT